jgi:myo-inositol 2-dehydrogenase / D-chiro-inositol 1-dehydrogenase
MCGFSSRRFDESFRDVYSKVEKGLIDRPFIVLSRACDTSIPRGFSLLGCPAWSSGVFLEMSAHDIDLTLWLFGEQVIPQNVAAYGISSVHQRREKYNGHNTAMAIVQFWGGQVANYYCSRVATPGRGNVAELIGRSGKISINTNPQDNSVSYYGLAGIAGDLPAAYMYDARFEGAVVQEAIEFAECCLENKKLPLDLDQALKAVQIGAWIHEALVKGIQITFDRTGTRIK